MLGRYKTRYLIDGKEVTPAQLLERLGFTNAHLSMPVGSLSGGQKRRLQLMLILLDSPNVLILDEPSNDLDTDMLVAMENLLDAWPGTLIVVSHDRYLTERVTDDQFALVGEPSCTCREASMNTSSCSTSTGGRRARLRRALRPRRKAHGGSIRCGNPRDQEARGVA